MTAPFHTRDEWAVRHPAFGRLALPVSDVFAHHTAGPFMDRYDAGAMRALEDSEVLGRPDQHYIALAYHEVYASNGEGIESRPLWAMGGATFNQNSTSVAICLPGNYLNAAPTFAQVETAIERLTAMVLYGVARPDFRLRPHRAVYPTDCPGHFEDVLGAIRSEVANRVAGKATQPGPTGPPQPPAGELQAFLEHLATAVAETKFFLAHGMVLAHVNPPAHNDAVWSVQLALNSADSAGLVVDSTYGAQTAAAVGAFQHAHGLNVDGIVGPVTYGALYPG